MTTENPQAFPTREMDICQDGGNKYAGMTLRDYFATKVLNGIFANNEMWINMCNDRKGCTRDKYHDTIEDYVAQQCYKMADAMLKERLK